MSPRFDPDSDDVDAIDWTPPAVPTARDRLDPTAPVTIDCSFQDLARAVHATFYPAIQLHDAAGVARIGRAAARLLEALPDAGN